MEFKIAIVKWIDSTYYRADYVDNDNDIEQIHPRTLISCGFLIYEDSDCIVLAQDKVLNHDPKRVVISIPKVSIIKQEIFTKKLKDF